MFNLLVFNVDWESRKVAIPMGRMFEHTDANIADQFRVEGRPLLDRLISLPCLFCEEGTEDEIAYVGKINRSRATGNVLSLEISLDAEVPPLKNSMIYENRMELDIRDEFEFSRNHWAVKDIDLYRFLLRNTRPRRQRPKVFKIPEHETINPKLASAMMPFEGKFSPVYETIQKAAKSVGLKCRRADDIWDNAEIIQDVVDLIDRSRVVICDCTGRNPNVFYEAGIAHTLGREVILIAQSENDIPFDLRHIRYIHYLNNAEGRAVLEKPWRKGCRPSSGTNEFLHRAQYGLAPKP